MGITYASGGRPPTMETTGSAELAIHWAATLNPFADELPFGTDWVEFVEPPASRVELMSDTLLESISGTDRAVQWRQADERNLALNKAIPVPFVRDTAIRNVNYDQAHATAARLDLTIDPFHHRVVTQRFNDETGWRCTGISFLSLFPRSLACHGR